MASPVYSEISGVVWKIKVDEGQAVSAGQVLMVMESMKMEIPVETPVSGTCRLLVAEGDNVQDGALLANIDLDPG